MAFIKATKHQRLASTRSDITMCHANAGCFHREKGLQLTCWPLITIGSCCVDRFCRSVDNQLSDRQVCINCNCIAHLVCSKLLQFQTPVDINFVVSPKDLTNVAKSRIKAIPKSDHDKFHFCILCQAKIKVIKVKKLARKSTPGPPRKSPANAKLPTKLFAELRRLAEFHCQAYVFLHFKNTKKAMMHGLIYEQFHGDDEKRLFVRANNLLMDIMCLCSYITSARERAVQNAR